jgi:hypothetical protein
MLLPQAAADLLHNMFFRLDTSVVYEAFRKPWGPVSTLSVTPAQLYISAKALTSCAATDCSYKPDGITELAAFDAHWADFDQGGAPGREAGAYGGAGVGATLVVWPRSKMSVDRFRPE